jgi:hypothetical protein
MTQIGSITINIPASYKRTGYQVTLFGLFYTSGSFNQLREMFAKAEYGAAVHQIPGARPWGEDLTDDLANTQYCTFTHGTSGKVQDGYYLLMPGHSFVEDQSAEGHSYTFSVNLFFLGTIDYYSHAYRVKDIDEVVNDWGI